MRETSMTPSTTAASEALVRIADVLLEVHQVVTGDALSAAVHNFRRWDHLVRRPLAVSSYALSLRQTEELLRPMGIPCSLVRRIFSSFARRLKSSGSWSRVLNEAPERRLDALGLFSGLALTCRATINDKLAIMFALFDPSESGTLTEDDLGAMVSSCASFLHHLGLSNPISNDEAAFAAGAAFGRQQAWAASSAATLCGTTSSEPRCNPDEIHFLAFSKWARSAELPTRAMGLLELPHRFSRVVDLVSAKAGSLLRERFLPWMNGSRGVSTKVHAVASNHQCAKQRAPASSPVASAFAQRMAADRRQRGNSVGLGMRPFVLSPFLRRIGPHGASITLEVGRNGAPAVGGSTWSLVVMVEERQGSRFSSVDSQRIVLHGGLPRVLVLSKLRAAKDHRLRMSWGVASRTSRRKDHATPQSARHPGAKQTTFRFTTLPADSAMMALPSQNPAESLSTGISPAACRRCIKLMSMEDARSWDALQLFRVETARISKGVTAHGGYVSVIVRHEHVTSVDSPEDYDAVDLWWAASPKSKVNALMSGNQAGSDMLVQSWPPPPQIADSGRPPPPTTTTLEDVPPLPTASIDAPFDRELRERNTEEAEGEDQHQFWPGKNSGGSDDIDLMVHLRPNWLAVEAIRRCFRILEQCRLQSLAIRGDGRRLVTSEISTAIRSLLSKSFHLQRRTSQDRARRTCAHTILGGVKNPWLGLGEDELMMHNKEHRNIIRREVESVLQTYLLSEGADTGARDGESEEVPSAEFLSNAGGMMAIGSRCFLIRPRRQRSNRDGDLSSPPIVVDDPESATASIIPSEIASGKGVRAESVVGPPASTTDGMDGEVGRPRRKKSQVIASEQDIPLQSNTLPSERARETSSIPAVNADRAATAEDDALARRDGPASPSTVDNDNHETNNASNQASQEVTEGERRIHLPQRTVEAERIAGASSGETQEVGGGSMVPASKDGTSKGEVGEAGGVTADAKPGAKDSPTVRPEDGDGCGMDGAGAGKAGAAPGDLALRESVGKPKVHEHNAALKVLLLDMSRAAEALLPAPARTPSASGGDGRQLEEERTGCTAVIFLDAPLIAPGLCRAWTLLQNEREETAILRRTSALAKETSAGLEDGALLDVDTRAPPRGNDASDVEPLGTSGGQHNDEGSRDALDPHEQHPAGLGDPNKALEALLLWIEEGESSGLGRREVLLLCPGADPAPLLRDGPVQHRESESRHSTATLSAHPGSVDDHGQEGSGSREESDAGEAGRQALHKVSEGGPSQGNDEDNAAGTDTIRKIETDDAHVTFRKGGSAAAAGECLNRQGSVHDLTFCAGGGPTKKRRPGMIQQIMLGEANPSAGAPAKSGEGSPVKEAPEGSSDVHESTRVGDEAGKKRGYSEEGAAKSNTDAGRVSYSPLLSSRPTNPSAASQPPPPSEFLLRTQPVAPDAESVSRVAIIFPPSSPRAVPCELSSPGEGKRGSSKAHPTTNPAPRNNPAPRELTRVLVGPVVGHVSPNSAVVLVEVITTNSSSSSAAEMVAADGVRRKGFTGVSAAADAVGVQLMDTLTGRRREMFGGEWTGGQPGIGPQVFNFRGLSPGRRYTLKLLGVRSRDQNVRTGGFHTPLIGESPPAMWAFSPLEIPGEALEEILADVQTARPTSTATLTIGPMVDSTKAAQALYPLVMAEKEEATRKKGGSSLGAMALDVFRQLYRHAWEEPRMRKLLANTATTPSTAGAGDLILPLLRNFPPGWLPYDPGAHTNPLTSGDTKARMRTTTTKRRSRARTKKVRSACGRARREGGVARALREVAGAAKQAADEYQGALLGGSGGPGAGSGVHRMSLGGAKGCGPPLPALQTWGGVGVLNVSVASSQVEWACGGRDAGRRLLSREAWAWLEDLFQAGPILKTLIVVTDSPLVWTSASSATAASAKKRCEEMSRNAQRGQKGQDRGVGRMHGRREKKGRSPFSFDSGRGSRDASPSWSAHPREAASLLSLLFSWAAAESDGNNDRWAPGSGATAREPSMSGTPGKGSGVAGKGDTAAMWPSSRRRRRRNSKEVTGGGGCRGGRVFSIVCPAACVRMNVQTCVKDSETGRVAVQWCVASKRSGDEALTPTSGSISPRFTFTHYPQADGANGPGATLIRPIPDPYAPCVKFLGLTPLGDSGSGSGGSGFAFGTLGPVLGEVGTSTARILVEVSVPMKLHLNLRKSGTTRQDVGSESTGDWQQLTKVVQSAHRPVLFEVDGLIPDTRYIVDFAPLANASEFRASLRTRPIRPFSFRIAAFGGSRNPFGYLPSAADVRPKSAIVVAGGGVTAITGEGNIAITGSGETGADGSPPSRESRLHRERWPFCAVDAVEGARASSDAAAARRESDSGMTVDLDSRSEAKVESEPRHGFRNGSGSRFDDTDELFCAERRSAPAGGGWRHPGATALAITVATDGARLGEMRRDSLLGSGGSDDALSACAEFNRSSAWKSMADEVELPVQGLDLVIHLGNEVNAAASLNRADVDEIAETFASESRLPAQRSLTDTLPPMVGLAADKGGGRSLLVRPPQLPVESPLALGERDEEAVSQLEAFLVKLHDEAERDRKRGDGEFRHRRIVEPSLAIRIDSPEDLVEAQGSGASSGGVGDLGVESGSVRGAGNADHSQREAKIDGTDASERGAGGDPVGDAYAWSLAAAEVAERVRDPYRVAWGLPWARAVMSSAPNALLAYTPLDLDEGCQEQVHAPLEDQPRAGGPRTEAAAERGGGNQDVDHPASVGRVREERLRAWVQYQAALAPGGGGRGNAPPGLDTAAGRGDKGTGNRNNSDDAKGGEEKGNGKGGGGGGRSRVDKRETDRGAYREYGGIGVLMLDVWGNQPWRLDMAGVATAKGADEEDPGFHPKALLSKRQEKLVKKALASSSTNALIICSGTPLVAEPVVHPKAPPLSESEQKSRDKALSVARKELKKLGKAGLAEIQRMAEEEKIPKLAMLSPEEVGAMDAFYDESRPCFHWSYHSPYLQSFLEKLFDWAIEGAIPTKKGQPSRKRDVVFLCGGTGCGVRTELRDRRSGLSFTQLCVGRMSDATVPCPWPLAAGSIGDRVIFTHRPVQHRETSGNLQRGQTPSELALTKTGDSNPAGRRSNGGGNGGSDNMNSGSISSFALVTVLSEPLDALMTAALVQPPGSVAEASPYNTKEVDTHGVAERRVASQTPCESGGEKSAIILGPVVGRVEVVRQSGLVRESCRVPVVIEVDREGEIACVMRDVATSETFREKRVLKPRRPRAFWVQGLRPARRYAIEFEGVSNSRDRTGSLTTPDSSHPDLTMVAVSHDRPGELPSGGEANLWGALVERLRSPWHAVEAVIHVGGQVDLSNAFGDGKASLERLEGRRKAGKVSEEEEVSVMEAVKERLREEYRKVWNQPCTRKALASCQHIMMWGQGECCAGYGRGGHAMVSSWAGRRLLRLAQEVFHEYQRQLWDPRWGCPFKVGDSESFYTTFLQGTVGILSLDSLELSPQWDSSRGSGSGVRKDESEGAVADRKMPDADPVNGARLGPRANAKLGESEEEGSPLKEVPLIGDSQWQRLKKTLEEQESLVTLIVVTETPIAWHDTETFLAEAQGADVGGSSDKPAPCLEDHWAARPIQQRALLMHLFQWKAEGSGREIILLAGAGLAEGCTAAETRLEYKMLPLQVPSAGPEGEGKEKEQGQGKRRGGQEGTGDEDEEEKKKPKKAKRRLIAIQQVTCGPITAEPTEPPGASAVPAKGTIFIPLTDAEKAQKRLIKANSYKNVGKGGHSGGSDDLLVGGGGMLADQEPVGFKHLKTWGRNYAVLRVIADNDEEGPIGVVDTTLVTPSSLDKTHPKQELSRPPGWWSRRCVGDRTVLLDDDTYLKGQGLKAIMDAREWLETSQDFVQTTHRSYDDFYIADCGRPTELRTINVGKTAVLKQHLEDGIRAVYRTLPAHVADELAYVPDQMILDFVLIKACPEVKVSALDTAEKWEEVCRQTCTQAAFIRVAALWAEEEEEVLLFADARAEEDVRKKEAKLRRQRQREIEDAEKDAAEMADLMANDPEAHMRRVVQKRADDADRRKREANAKGQDDSLAEGERATLDRKKAEDKERLAREAKEKEAREQQELNELADSDPAEYDRRIKEWQKRKIEGRDGTSSSLDVGGGGDGVDQTQNGDLERRKSLARERRAVRRAAMHARPSVGIPKT